MFGDSDNMDPYFGLFIVGVMFIAVGVGSLLLGSTTLVWSFLPMGVILVLIWFTNRTTASDDDV